MTVLVLKLFGSNWQIAWISANVKMDNNLQVMKNLHFDYQLPINFFKTTQTSKQIIKLTPKVSFMVHAMQK